MDYNLTPAGVELADDAAAKQHALRAAYQILSGDMLAGKVNLNAMIEVTDEAGNLVHTVRFRDLVEFAE